MIRFVVDASVAVKWLVEEEDSEIARGLAARSGELHAPRLMASEVSNSVWRKVRTGQLNRRDAIAKLEQIEALPVKWHFDEIIAPDALLLAILLKHPAYDCFYLALANSLKAILVTADRRFMNALSSTEFSDNVTMLSNFPREL